jgi:hypothetical protein
VFIFKNGIEWNEEPFVLLVTESQFGVCLPHVISCVAMTFWSKVVDFFYSDPSIKALQKDTLWKPKECLWVAFLGKKVPTVLPKNLLNAYLLQKQFKITEATPSKLAAQLEVEEAVRSIDARFGYNEAEEKMLHVHFKFKGGCASRLQGRSQV